MNLRRTAANSAILTGLSLLFMFFVWMVLVPAAGLNMQDSMQQPTKVGEFALAHRGIWMLGCLSDLICSVTIPLLTLGLYRKFQKNQPGRSAMIGLFGLMAGTLFGAAGAIGVLAPNFVAKLADPAGAIAALGAVQQPIEITAIFFISLSTWNVARAAQRTGAFNALTIYAGYFASLGVLSLPLNMISVEAGMMGMAPAFGAILYNFGLGMSLMNATKNQELETAMAA